MNAFYGACMTAGTVEVDGKHMHHDIGQRALAAMEVYHCQQI